MVRSFHTTVYVLICWHTSLTVLFSLSCVSSFPRLLIHLWISGDHVTTHVFPGNQAQCPRTLILHVLQTRITLHTHSPFWFARNFSISSCRTFSFSFNTIRVAGFAIFVANIEYFISRWSATPLNRSWCLWGCAQYYRHHRMALLSVSLIVSKSCWDMTFALIYSILLLISLLVFSPFSLLPTSQCINRLSFTIIIKLIINPQ